jgi:hypothetical protein
MKDEKGKNLSKQFIGILAGVTLCAVLFINIYREHPVEPTIVNTVVAICIDGLISI